MVHIPSPPAGPDAILTALRREVKAAGGKRVSLRRFVASSGIPEAVIFRHFARWEDTVRAAGFEFSPTERIDRELLLADWGTLARTLQRLPSKSEYKVHGKYCTHTLTGRFGSWTAVPRAFLKFAKDKPEWTDLQSLIPTFQENKPGRNSKSCASKGGRKYRLSRYRPQRPRRLSWARRLCSGLVYGDPLGLGAMMHAPVNEGGVLMLFGIMAERLGFMIESVRSNFPDCEAKRKVGVNEWRRIRIEFEYESRNFRMHRHDPAGCDLIVCWAHNWPDCPVEVLALRDELAGMDTMPTAAVA